jgi:uncharacterized protein
MIHLRNMRWRLPTFLHLPIYLLACAVCPYLAAVLLAALGIPEASLAALLGITLATWLSVRYLDGGHLRDLGLAWRRSSLPDLVVGLAMPVILLMVFFALEWAAGWLMIVGMRPVSPVLLAGSLGRFAAIAWYEELFSRGYLMQTLARMAPLWVANLITALIFTALHIWNPGFTWPALLGVFPAGILLGYCYIMTRSLYLPMAFHFAWNFVQAMLGFPVSGTSQFGLFRLIREGPPLFTGGAFGPEASLFGFFLLLIALGSIREYAKRMHRT